MEISRSWKVVCFGGSNGLPTLLRGLRNDVFKELTAVATVFNYGSKFKEIVDEHGLLRPDVMAQCFLALSPHEELHRDSFTDTSNTEEHSALDLLISGAELFFGSRQLAHQEISRILDLAEHHRVLPITKEYGRHLCAKMQSGRIANTEPEVSAMVREGEIVELLDLNVATKGNADVLNAIDAADIIIAGPGRFYTSVLPNFLPDGIKNYSIKEHIAASSAPLFFIMNLLTDGRGMNHMSAKDIVEFAEKYIGRKVDVIIANNNIPKNFNHKPYELEGKIPIELTSLSSDPRLAERILWTDPKRARHNSHKLANYVYRVAERWYQDHPLRPAI